MHASGQVHTRRPEERQYSPNPEWLLALDPEGCCQGGRVGAGKAGHGGKAVACWAHPEGLALGFSAAPHVLDGGRQLGCGRRGDQHIG